MFVPKCNNKSANVPFNFVDYRKLKCERCGKALNLCYISSCAISITYFINHSSSSMNEELMAIYCINNVIMTL